MNPLRALRVAGVWCAVSVLLGGPAALAAEGSTFGIDRVDTDAYPEVHLEVTAPGSVAPEDPAAAFTVTEDGEPQRVRVARLPSEDVQTVLLIDTSGSMDGSPIEAAGRAAGAFLERLPRGVQVAVVAFGGEPAVLAPFPSDRAAKRAAVAELPTDGETALYDGVVTAIDQFSGQPGTDARSIVLLSDGGDTTSRVSLDDATARLRRSGVRLHAVELRTPESDPRSLQRLAGINDGRVVPVDDAGGLDAVYTSLASQLVNRFELTYDSDGQGTATVRVEVQSGTVQAAAERQVPLPATPAVPAPASAPVGEVVMGPGLLGNPLTVVGGGLAVFLGLLGSASVLFAGRGPTRRLSLENGLLRATRPSSVSGLADHATTLAERHLERHGWRGSLNAALERAGLDLRSGEYVVLAVSAAVTAFAAGLVVANAVVGLLLAVLAGLCARFALSVLSSRRRARFADQLGDVLQLLAGSLRAGYGLLQAIDAIAREADQPAADEFERIVVESRLGRDVNRSLRALAERMESEDFAWVVQAIEIHREVGGDLAEVLDTVAGTIRERNQIRRQVKALSAEGRYSAYVLVALPFVVAGLISVTNPGYLSELTTSVAGVVMLAVAVLLMAGGAVWLRKLTRLVF